MRPAEEGRRRRLFFMGNGKCGVRLLKHSPMSGYSGFKQGLQLLNLPRLFRFQAGFGASQSQTLLETGIALELFIVQ